MNQPQKRRQFPAEQKTEVVRRHLIGKIPVSDLVGRRGNAEMQPDLR